MKRLLTVVLSLCMCWASSGQVKVGTTSVINGNGGQGTNTTLRGTNNVFRGNANEYHPLTFLNEQLGGSTLINFSFGDNSSITSNRWRLGANSVNFNIYDVKTDRFPLSIASADGSAGGDGNININGVSITTNGATYITGGATISNSLSITSSGAGFQVTHRVGHTNGTAVYRYHLGDDMGQTYSWQTVASTNRYLIQRQNSDLDFPFMITRTGMKIGSGTLYTTNTGNMLIAAGDLAVGTGTGASAISNNAGATTITTSNSTASRITQRTAGVGIGTNAPSALLHAVGGAILFQRASTPTMVGGTHHVNVSAIANAGTAATNVFTNYIPGNTLTNLGDTEYFEAAGQTMNAAATTNRWQVTYGSETVLDTGATGLFSNTTYRIEGSITRVGNTAQIVEIGIKFSGLGVGSPFNQTNNVVATVQTNGADMRLVVTVTSLRNGGVTNLMGRQRYFPSP